MLLEFCLCAILCLLLKYVTVKKLIQSYLIKNSFSANHSVLGLILFYLIHLEESSKILTN